MVFVGQSLQLISSKLNTVKVNNNQKITVMGHIFQTRNNKIKLINKLIDSMNF